jgi:hypothetical protein
MGVSGSYPLESDASISIVDVLGEGPIKGWYSHWSEDILFDNVPLFSCGAYNRVLDPTFHLAGAQYGVWCQWPGQFGDGYIGATLVDTTTYTSPSNLVMLRPAGSPGEGTHYGAALGKYATQSTETLYYTEVNNLIPWTLYKLESRVFISSLNIPRCTGFTQGQHVCI